MIPLNFEWDKGKDTSNRKKHGVSFDEAQAVFYDEAIRIISARKATRTEGKYYMDRWTK